MLRCTMALSLRDASIIMHLGQRSVEGNHKGCGATVASSAAPHGAIVEGDGRTRAMG